MDGAKSGTRPYRLGAFVDGVGWVEHEYGRVYERREDRIIAAPDRDQVDLMVRLARGLNGPFQVTYTLLVPRDDEPDEGRFELTRKLDHEEIRSFLVRYGELFENDGRHHVGVESADEDASIVYDQHNVLYLRGPLSRFEAVLEDAGLREGAIVFPSPHSHHYHPEHDQILEDMLGRYRWNWFPLSMAEESARG